MSNNPRVNYSMYPYDEAQYGQPPYSAGYLPPASASQDPFGYSGLPAQIPQGTGNGGQGGLGGLGGLLNGFNFNNLRQMIDRMGGLDGLLENVGKMQKIMGSVQQMAPMIKLLLNTGKTAKATSSMDRDDDFYVPRRRRRRRRRRSGSSRRRRQVSVKSKVYRGQRKQEEGL